MVQRGSKITEPWLSGDLPPVCLMRPPLSADSSQMAPGIDWASVYSAFVAGAGVARGAVYGSSDRFAAQPVTGRVYPWDVAATMFWALGIDPALTVPDFTGRPMPLLDDREPIAELL